MFLFCFWGHNLGAMFPVLMLSYTDLLRGSAPYLMHRHLSILSCNTLQESKQAHYIDQNIDLVPKYKEC